MSGVVYYNEIDDYAVKTLRNLIAAGHIAPGIVDERSIEDVLPRDLDGFTQCHFFAGVGVWSYALRQAGWPDERPVWTGSCPCQPFSAAGKGVGFADERHLWPAFHHLIKECKPATVIGEQVASKDADPWIDLVQADLEALGYAVGAIPFPSAGIGAPHIRDRLYWVGHAVGERLEKRQRFGIVSEWPTPGNPGKAPERAGIRAGGVADHDRDGCHPRGERGEAMGHRETAGANCGAGGLANTKLQPGCTEHEQEPRGWRAGSLHTAKSGRDGEERGPGPTNGFWRDADWLLCRDGKWRPVEPGTFPLAHGAPARVGRLRAYGNAINAKAAQSFIECVMEAA